jgi:hypothetical protein
MGTLTEWMLASLNLTSGEGGIQYLLSVCSRHVFVQSVPPPGKVSFCTGKPVFLVKGQTAELPPMFKTVFTLVRLQSGVIYMFHIKNVFIHTHVYHLPHIPITMGDLQVVIC